MAPTSSSLRTSSSIALLSVIAFSTLAWLFAPGAAAVGVGSAMAAPSVDTTGGSTIEPASNDVATETSIADDSTAGEGSIVENPLGTQDDEELGATDEENRKLWAVIGGLVLVALALTALTVRYWRQTRPAPRQPDRGTGGRRSRSADEPVPHEELGTDLFVDES